MKTREVSVIGRSVYGNGEVTLIRTSVGIDQMHVLFDSVEWVAFGAVSVTFKNSADAENPITTSITPTAIDSPDWSAEATCLIPWEVIQDVGSIAVTFQATDSSSNHIITARAENVLSVIEAGDVNEGTVPSTAPSLSEWEQAYADAMAAASSAADAAEQISNILSSTDAQTLEELIAALGSALRYKGSVSTYADLPEDAEQGDTYNVATAYGDYPAGTNWAWTGTQWDALGGEIDLSQFATKDVATTSADGLMSATDKAKLDGVEADANNYTLPTMDADTRGGAKLGSGLKVEDGTLSLGNIVTDSCDGPIYSVDAEGWSEQDGTPTPENPVAIEVCRGRNLLDTSSFATVTVGGVTFTRQDDGGIKVTGTALNTQIAMALSEHNAAGIAPNVEYTLSGCPNGGSSSTFDLRVSDTVTAAAMEYGSGRVFSYANVDSFSVLIMIRSGVTMNHVFYPQIELGSTPTPYVPFGHVGLEVQGMNLLKVSSGYNIIIGSVKGGQPYVFSFTATSNAGFSLKKNNGSGTALAWSDGTGVGRKSYQFTPDEDCDLYLNGWGGMTSAYDYQLELGDTAHAYQPYHHTTTPIPLPSKGWAGGLPDGTADELAIDSAGKWEWTNNADEVVFDGSDDEVWMQRSGTNHFIVNTLNNKSLDNIVGPPIDYGYPSLASSFSRYSAGASFNSVSDGEYMLGPNSLSSSTNWLIVRNDSVSDLASLKSWLASNNLTLLHSLAAPTTEHGYVDLPMDIPEGSTVTIPELENTNVRCFVPGAKELAIHAANWGHRNAEMESRLAAVESALAELATA